MQIVAFRSVLEANFSVVLCLMHVPGKSFCVFFELNPYIIIILIDQIVLAMFICGYG